MYAIKIVIIIAIICITALSSVSTAIPYWLLGDVIVDEITEDVYAGLWEICTEASGTHECISFTEISVKDFVIITRDLMLTGTAMFGLSLLLALKYALCQGTERVAKLCIKNLVLGAVLLITAMIIFAIHTTDASNVSYGPAFYLPIPASIFAIVTACAVCVAEAFRVSNENNQIGQGAGNTGS